MTSEAAQLAEALRAAKKVKALSGSQIAEQIERLTGSRPSLMWVSRRLRGDNGRRPMVQLSGPCPHCGQISYSLDPTLQAMSEVLGVDPDVALTGSTPAVEVAP